MTEFLPILPEIFLVITLAGLVFSEVGYHGERVRLLTATALLGLGGALLQTLLSYQYEPALIFSGAIAFDGYSVFFKLFFILLAVLAIVSATRSREIDDQRRAEYSALIIASVLAMCLAASVNDLLLAFLCIQAINVLSHFLTAFGRRSLLSTEASVKHLLFAAVAGVLFLYAGALLFAATRTLNLVEMHRVLIAHPLSAQTELVVFTLMFLALAFQFAAFPMHLWAPDVLEGAPTPVSAFVSVGSRAAGFALAGRLLLTLFARGASPNHWVVLGSLDWPSMIAILAGLTMLVGALLALRQVAARRMVACLVIAQTGFLLLGLLVLNDVGFGALLYNLIAELFALMGVFYVIALFQDELQSDRLADWRGMLGRAVPETICLLMFLGSLVGLPPFGGFIGRFSLVGAAISHRWYALSLVAMASWALGVVAVTRFAYSLVGDFRSPTGPGFESEGTRFLYLAIFLIPMALISLFAADVFTWTNLSLRPLLLIMSQ